MVEALAHHWPEYLIEAALLSAFMVAACAAVTLVHHPSSQLTRRVRGPIARRAIIGAAMGLVAIALIYSPWGRRSGAHMNPAMTLTQLALGRVAGWDALFYILAQFAGGLGGVGLAALLLGPRVRHDTVRYAVTVPGARGVRAAWVAECVIAFILMQTVLWTGNHAATAPFTGVFCGALVAVFITVEAPWSGMSMNPARSLGSAVPARTLGGVWVYFTAPVAGMLLGAGAYVATVGPERVYCAKLNHAGAERCVFRCRIDEMPGHRANPAGGVGISTHAPSDPHRP